MRTGALCFVLALLALLAPSAGVAAQGEVNCHYVSNGLVGELTIMGAQGLPYRALDSRGAMVGMGVATTVFVSVPVLGAAPGPLQVQVGAEMHLASSRDGEWQ